MNGNAKTVDEYLRELPKWQVERLQLFRGLIHRAQPDVSEDIKWGVPVFIHNSKVVFTMAAFKDHAKYNFILNGALLDDKQKLFNNGLESKKSRSIDSTEEQSINKSALEILISQALLQAG